MKRVTACTLDCPDACSLIADFQKNGTLKITGNPDHPFTKGFCCPKGMRTARRNCASDRILHPLLKKKGVRRRISWDSALNLCAEKINELRQHPESLLHIRGYGYRGAAAQASTHFFGALGACATRGSLCDDTGIEASILDFGTLNHNNPEDIPNAGRIINWGRDLPASSVHTAALVRQARADGARVLTISPGGDHNRALSDRMIRIRPGTDRFLAAAAAKILLADGVRGHVPEKAFNLPQFQHLLESVSLKDCLRTCDVPESDAALIADRHASPEPLTTLIGWGIQRYRFGGENIRFINALSFLSGQVGRRGAGVYYNIASGRNLASWEHLMQPAPAPDRKTLLLPRMGREIAEASPAIRMAWVDGHNAVNQVPDAGAAARAFEQIPFTVVADAFMNDTMERADLILPCALPLEREDVIGSCFHNFVNYAAKVMDPPGEARSDFDILADLGRRLDPQIILPKRDECLKTALAQECLDTTLEDIRSRGFTEALRPKIAFENMEFGHADGKYRFPESLHPEPRPEPEYPLMLLSFIDKKYTHSQIPEHDQAEPPEVRVSRSCPYLDQLDMDRDTYLATPAGRIRVRITFSDTLHPEAVLIRRGKWMKHNACANPLIAPLVTDIAEGAAYYSQTARLENE